MLRLEEEDIYAGIATSGSGGGSAHLKFNLYYPFEVLSDGEDGAFNATWQAYGSNDVYVSSFKFEENEDGTYRLTPSGVTKNGKLFGTAKVGAIIMPDGEDSTVGSSSLFTPLDSMTRTENSEGDYTYSFNIGDNTANFLFFYNEPESMTNPTYGQGKYLDKNGNTIGSCGIFWLIEELPPAPIQKGSFNASTQMLTFNNSYLVEKVNSSITSQAQKDAILQQLGDNDVVINMNVDRAEGLPVTLNSWLLGDDKEAPIGAMIVSKTNPVTIKFLFTGDSGLMFLDWSAYAEYLSLQGTTITPEQAEEQYGAYVVDENVCTVSGTLGNFSVELN